MWATARLPKVSSFVVGEFTFADVGADAAVGSAVVMRPKVSGPAACGPASARRYSPRRGCCGGWAHWDFDVGQK